MHWIFDFGFFLCTGFVCDIKPTIRGQEKQEHFNALSVLINKAAGYNLPQATYSLSDNLTYMANNKLLLIGVASVN